MKTVRKEEERRKEIAEVALNALEGKQGLRLKTILVKFN